MLPSVAPLQSAAWENGAMLSLGERLRGGWRALARSRRVQAVCIAGLVVLLAVFTWVVPSRADVLHNILHHLNILPFMLAGLIFGWRGALRAVLLATVLQAPSIHRHWYVDPLDAQDQIVELSTFGLAGLIAGVVAERERLQRLRAETTQVELQRVYTELQQNVEQLRKTERLTAAGRLSASLAHEIRNPLASISGAAGILARGVAPETSRRECLEILTVESQRLNKLLTGFLDFARPRLPRMQAVDARALLESVVVLAQHAMPGREIAVEPMQGVTQGDEIPLRCDPEQIRQVLLNLILNALQATAGGGGVRLRSRVLQGIFAVEIEDQGQGISAADLDHVFDPFFTTKAEGTGLGLAIAATIVAQHGGELVCSSAGVGQGSIFRMQLPREGAFVRAESLVARGVA